MLKKTIITFIAIFFIGTINLAAQTKTETKLPDTPVGKRADAMLKTIAQADEATVRKFIEENGSEGMRALPLEKHLDVFQGLRHSLEGMVITDVKSSEPDYIEITIRTRSGRIMLLEIQLTPAPSSLIDGIGFGEKKRSSRHSAISPIWHRRALSVPKTGLRLSKARSNNLTNAISSRMLLRKWKGLCACGCRERNTI